MRLRGIRISAESNISYLLFVLNVYIYLSVMGSLYICVLIYYITKYPKHGGQQYELIPYFCRSKSPLAYLLCSCRTHNNRCERESFLAHYPTVSQDFPPCEG